MPTIPLFARPKNISGISARLLQRNASTSPFTNPKLISAFASRLHRSFVWRNVTLRPVPEQMKAN